MLSEIDSKAKEDLDSSQYEDLVLHNAATMFGGEYLAWLVWIYCSHRESSWL
jgi:hypothetical protein